MPGTFAVTAQSPSDTRMRVWSAHHSNLLEVVFAADRALDKCDVNHGRKLLDVHKGAVNEVGPRRDV